MEAEEREEIHGTVREGPVFPSAEHQETDLTDLELPPPAPPTHVNKILVDPLQQLQRGALLLLHHTYPHTHRHVTLTRHIIVAR